MVCRLFVAALVLLLVVGIDVAAANEIAGYQPLSADTAALFSLQEPDKADDEAEESDEADESEKEDEKKSDETKEDAEASDEEKVEKSDDSKATSDEKAKDADAAEEESSTKAEEDKEKGDEEEKSEEKTSDEKKSAAKKEKPAEEKKPETVKVKTKDLKIEVEAEAVFVAEEAEEVALRPEVWSTFKVLEAVPHGKRVRKGDVLVKFDDKDIEEALAEKELQQRLGELALMEAEEEFPRTEKSIVLNYEQAQREYDQAKDEYERFEKQMREMSEKLAEYYLKSAEQDFESAQEELDQLVKMYEADELTEETEEIVLRRQKFQVEAAKFFVDYSKINHDYTMNVSIPRREEMLKTAVDMAKIEFERAKMAKSLGMNQQRYELQSLRETRARSVENHAKLVEDRELMTLKSPADGIAYYGRQVNGRWIEVSSLEQ